jgi:type IV pilus assembly protein PilX
MTTTMTANKRQEGIVLAVVLILLVAMTLLAVGLTRITDTAIQVANNISFKQSTVSAADSAIEQAINTLRNTVADKAHDSPANGYYATEQTGRDFTGSATPGNPNDDVTWTGANSTQRAKVGTAVGGNNIAYIIHRMCSKPGGLTVADDGTANSCATSSAAASSGGSKGGAAYGQQVISSKTQIYYRITVRTEGARNTASYVQSMVLLEY